MAWRSVTESACRYTSQEASGVKQTRIERKARRHRDDRSPILPLDPRDADILRAKRLQDAALKYRGRI